MPKDGSKQYSREADALAATINRLAWNPRQRFYFDLTVDGKHAPVKSVGAYWTLIAGVASPEQAASLAAQYGFTDGDGRVPRPLTLADV